MVKRNTHGRAIRVEFKSDSTKNKLVPKTVQNVVNHKMPIGCTPSEINTVMKCQNPSSVLVSGKGSRNVDVQHETQLEKIIRKVSDKESLKAATSMWEEALKERGRIRAENTNVSYEEFEALVRSKKLDSNLKKCTAFVRKLRQYHEAQKVSMESDIKTLNLSKYLSEIAAALAEAKLKLSDTEDIIGICSLIHQRYSDFANLLLENYKRTLALSEKDFCPSVLNKLTVDLRLVGELTVSGIIPTNEGFSVLHKAISNLILMDKEGTQAVVLIITFSRGLGYEMAGVLPRNFCKLRQEHKIQLPLSDVISAEKKTQMLILLKDFYRSVENSVLKYHEEVLDSENHNRKIMKTRGELPSDRQDVHTELTSHFKKFLLNAKRLANILDEEVPQLRVLPADPEEEEKTMMIAESGEQLTMVPGIVLFENEETRSFYQDFADLKVYSPPLVYREKLLQTADVAKAIAEREKQVSCADEEMEQAELKIDVYFDEEAIQTEDCDLPPSMRADTDKNKKIEGNVQSNFQNYLVYLSKCVNRNMIDKAAVEFVEGFNTRSNRKKLTKTLFHIPRKRVDLLPLWSRLVAILTPVMPDISIDLCEMLRKHFRYLIRKKDQIFIETKLKITRFIAELVNFSIFPKSDALQCLKLLLMDFVHHQIEMACVLVETCGRFLNRSPDSHQRMKIYLEEMIRKKTVKALEPRYVAMVEHAYFQVCPPEGGIPRLKKRSALQSYVEKLLYCDLSKSTVEECIMVMRCLNWKDPQVFSLAVRCLSQPWELSFLKLPNLAKLIASLSDFQPEVSTVVVDNILEDVQVGIEMNNVKFNQRRIAVISFLGELYNYKLVGSATIFNTLYLLISYGVTMERGMTSILDPPDNLFRVRLACSLLRVCGDYLNYGNSRKKLNYYLKYLQRYYWFKRKQDVWKKTKFPYAIQEFLEDTLRKLRPKMKMYENWEETCADVQEFENEMTENVKSHKNFPKSAGQLPTTVDTNYEKSESDQKKMKSLSTAMKNMAVFQSTVEHGSLDHAGSSAYPNFVHSKIGFEGSPKLPVVEDDEEFIQNLDRLCSQVDYSAARDGGRHMKSDIPIPLHIRSSSLYTKPSFGEGGSAHLKPETVNFVLLTRKGSKQQFKSLPVPADSDFVVKIKTREEVERAEKERVKKITLGMNQMQDAEEYERMLNPLYKNGREFALTPGQVNLSYPLNQTRDSCTTDSSCWKDSSWNNMFLKRK